MTMRIHIVCWRSSTWSMTILYLVHSLSSLCYWILHTCIRYDIFHPWCLFLLLGAYQYQLIILVRLLVFFFFFETWLPLCTYRSWFRPRFCNRKSSQTLYLLLYTTSVMISTARLLQNSCFSESFPVIHEHVKINIFPQHETGFVNISITELHWVFISPG